MNLTELRPEVAVWFGGGSTNIMSQCSITVIFKKLKTVVLGKMCVYAWCTAKTNRAFYHGSAKATLQNFNKSIAHMH